MWGKLDLHHCGNLMRRVIPTGVGKAASRARGGGKESGHPHGCGESFVEDLVTQFGVGSSPRVWGKPRAILWSSGSLRVIPTGVGKAPRMRSPDRANTGHPHGCGESASAERARRISDGSSPRVWGKLWASQRVVIRWRRVFKALADVTICHASGLFLRKGSCRDRSSSLR